MILNYETDVMNKYSNEIIAYANELEAEINKLNVIIDQINNVWNGSDALKYINIMREKYTANLKELKNIINDYGTYLQTSAKIYEKIEEKYSKK